MRDHTTKMQYSIILVCKLSENVYVKHKDFSEGFRVVIDNVNFLLATSTLHKIMNNKK